MQIGTVPKIGHGADFYAAQSAEFWLLSVVLSVSRGIEAVYSLGDRNIFSSRFFGMDVAYYLDKGLPFTTDLKAPRIDEGSKKNEFSTASTASNAFHSMRSGDVRLGKI